MRIPALLFFFTTLSGLAAPPQDLPDIDEAFRLSGVRARLESLPSHVNEMTAVAISQLPRDQRAQFEPVLKDMMLRFLDPDAFYQQLRTYFARRSDPSHMATFLALERTPLYRTMHRVEQESETPAAQASRRRFEATLQSDPPSIKRVQTLQHLDEITNATGTQVKIVTAVMNAMAAGMGARMPADLDKQSAAFNTKIQPVLASQVLHANLFIYRNVEDADLEDYVSAMEQKDVDWFNRNLQAAILAVSADRATRAGEYLKSKIATAPPAN